MTPCPTNDTLGAHVQRALAGDAQARVQVHLDECDACRDAVIAAVRGAQTKRERIARGTPSMPPTVFAAMDAAGGTAPPEIGGRIGRYEIRALLGAGGMGRVYEAYDAELDRAIALKVLRPELAAPTLAERLVRESRMMARLAHPAVITVYDAGVDGKSVFIAMELIRGQTLAARLYHDNPRWREIVGLFEKAAHGLAAAHAAGIVHRDFKPDNVLVERDGRRVVVTDFGIARIAAAPTDADDVRLTSPGFAVGTPAYMAPEQLAGGVVDARADVFAVCVSMWEALFGERPFPGKTVDDIRAAMARPLRAPRTRVPGWLVRKLMRGLAIDPAQRHADAGAFVADLRRHRVRRRALAIGSAAIALVGAGVAGALALRPATVDPCEAGRDATARAYPPARAALLHAMVPAAPAAYVDRVALTLADTEGATCHAGAEPAQAPATTACLDARRLELDTLAGDLVRDHGRSPTSTVALMGDPTACADPAPGLLVARVPADGALEREVAQIRYRIADAETARDRGDYAKAQAIATSLDAPSAKLWPPLHAEVLYTIAVDESLGGDHELALEQLREAAAYAEAQHHDYIAANAWLQLCQGTTADQGDPQRGLEYVTYASAAIDRLGRPPSLVAILEYVKGTALVDLGRYAEAETALRHTVELARLAAPEYLPQALQGLGYLYEDEGRLTDAITAYRDALAQLPAATGITAVIFRERLAINLSHTGHADEAETLAREAVAIADKSLGERSSDRADARAVLAQVLEDAGKLDGALVASQEAVADLAHIDGERNERYGEMLELHGTLLADLGRFDQAAPELVKACDIIAFTAGDGSERQASCWMQEGIALDGLHRDREALALVDRVVPALVKIYGDDHPEVAAALVERAVLHGELGEHATIVADLERAIAIFKTSTVDAGHLAAAQWALGKELWARDRARAKSLIADALQGFSGATAQWKQTRADAAEWLATDGHPRHPE